MVSITNAGVAFSCVFFITEMGGPPFVFCSAFLHSVAYPSQNCRPRVPLDLHRKHRPERCANSTRRRAGSAYSGEDGDGLDCDNAGVATHGANRKEDYVAMVSTQEPADKDKGILCAVKEDFNGSEQPRHRSVLDNVGLAGKLSFAHMVPNRIITARDIFCNREINLSAIKAIGFDMDYTLAQYREPAFDRLAFDGGKAKLVSTCGYPRDVLGFAYDHEYWVRGLIIDTKLGNFVKIDRHKYVRLAHHGFHPISSPIRKSLYSRTFNKIPSFAEAHFVNLDTLFQKVDAHLFAHLIELKDTGDYDFLNMKTYEEMYRDVRSCVDLCHRDGVIKDVVAEHPERFIVHDDGLIPMLNNFRKAGMKVFLLTNSYWEYTSVAMNYLYHGKKVTDDVAQRNEWLEMFDVVVVGSCKPAYLVDPNLNLFRVHPRDGSLRNTDGLYEIDSLEPNGAINFLAAGKVFQGGNWLHLHAMLQIRAGEELLYVGDHLYADVLRSKRTLGWRTALIVPEIEQEMAAYIENSGVSRNISELRNLRDEVNLWCDTLRKSERTAASVAKIKGLEADDLKIKVVLAEIAENYHKAFHPVWGQMFLAGYQDSRFAFYVENYACLYTSKATNFGLVSTLRAFRTTAERLPHDKLLADHGNSFKKIR